MKKTVIISVVLAMVLCIGGEMALSYGPGFGPFGSGPAGGPGFGPGFERPGFAGGSGPWGSQPGLTSEQSAKLKAHSR